MREIYECKWCYGHFSDRAECVEHEPKCHDNPASRACETCDHHGDVVADTGKVWNTCAVGLLTSPRWVDVEMAIKNEPASAEVSVFIVSANDQADPRRPEQ